MEDWTTATTADACVTKGGGESVRVQTKLLFRGKQVHQLRGENGRMILQEKADRYNQEGYVPSFSPKSRGEASKGELADWDQNHPTLFSDDDY